MQQARPLFREAHEHAEVAARLDDALEPRADADLAGLQGRDALVDDRERDAPRDRVHRLDSEVKLLADLHHLARVDDVAAAAERGDRDKAVDARDELDERAERRELHDLSGDVAPGAEVLAVVLPGVLREVLEGEGEALVLPVDAADLHLHLVALVQDVLRLHGAVPRDLGVRDEPLDAADVDERAEGHDLRDDAVAEVALEERGAERLAA